MSADVIQLPVVNVTMLREAIEHLAAAEDMCGTGEFEPDFERIRASLYSRLGSAGFGDEAGS